MNITDAMVDAAAKALWCVDLPASTWDTTAQGNRDHWRHEARVALNAAAAVDSDDGFERALQLLVTAGAVRAANDALWTRPTGGVLDALQAVAEHLRAQR